MAPPRRVSSAAPTVAQALDSAAARLRAAGVEGARRDVRVLLAAALDIAPGSLVAWPERALGAEEAARAEEFVARRAAREPVSRILGRREFWSLAFRITPDTLDPRADSETLVEAVLAEVEDRTARLDILDLGTGSGCLLLALLSELPNARGVGVDIGEGALAAARDNAERLGMSGRARFVRGDWTAGLTGAWQAIVSNPPYITDMELTQLAPEVVRHDPRIALAGGVDGLDAYRAFVPDLGRLLAEGGFAALEVGAGQMNAVEALLTTAGCRPHRRIRDLGGNERCLLATAGDPAESAQKVVGK
jgi:release factor glutamine methyltransferase